MPDALGLLIVSLAAWRLAALLVNEDGPFFIARRIREAAGIQHDGNGDPYGIPETTIGGILGCTWCASFYTGVLMLALWSVVPLLVVAFAVNAVAVVIEVTVGRLKHG